MNIIRNYLLKVWHDSADLNNAILKSYIDPAEKARILDIGCGSGSVIKEMVNVIKNPDLYGFDILYSAVKSAKKQGIKARLHDVEKKLPYKSNYFDIVNANQIIEHVQDVDFFVNEIKRIIKPGGYLILGTENLSSWHNIVALILGWQAFSQHISKKRNIGNPMRLTNDSNFELSGMHIKIFTLRSLCELLELYGFKIEKKYGAGYYPTSGKISKLFSKIDPTHCAFIGAKAQKKSK